MKKRSQRKKSLQVYHPKIPQPHLVLGSMILNLTLLKEKVLKVSVSVKFQLRKISKLKKMKEICSTLISMQLDPIIETLKL